MVGEIFEIPRCEIAKIDIRDEISRRKRIYVVEISKRRLGVKKQTKKSAKADHVSNTVVVLKKNFIRGYAPEELQDYSLDVMTTEDFP